MRLRWPSRSPYVPCFSVATEPVNVPGGHKDVAVVVMRENELAVAKKVEDIHSIYGFGAR